MWRTSVRGSGSSSENFLEKRSSARQLPTLSLAGIPHGNCTVLSLVGVLFHGWTTRRLLRIRFSICPKRTQRCPRLTHCFAITLSWTVSTPLRSLHSIMHQAPSVSLQVRTGLASLKRLASGLSPVNKATTALAAIMIATATTLRIVHPWLKRW